MFVGHACLELKSVGFVGLHVVGTSVDGDLGYQAAVGNGLRGEDGDAAFGCDVCFGAAGNKCTVLKVQRGGVQIIGQYNGGIL